MTLVPRSNRYAIGAILGICVGIASVARADDAPGEAAEKYARELFEKADIAMRNTPPDYDAACEGFRKAYEIAHGLGALKKQAVCEEARGKLATALSLWKQAAAAPQSAERKAESDKQVTTLEGKVGRLIVEAPSSIAKLSLSVDGTPWVPGEAKPIDAGAHRVVFEGTDPSGQPSTQSVEVTVTNGQTATARLPESGGERPPSGSSPTGSSVAPLEPDAKSDSRSSLRVAGFVVGGVGVAGFVAFGVTGGLVLSTHAALQDACSNHESEPYSGCNADAPGLVSKGNALNIANVVSLGVGVVAVGVAIPLLAVGFGGPKKGPEKTNAIVVPWADAHSAGLMGGGGF